MKLFRKIPRCIKCNSEMLRQYTDKGGIVWVCPNVTCLMQQDESTLLMKAFIFCTEKIEARKT